MSKEIKFSPDQQKIIDSRDENILVSAAAGSGKTAVLVERIIQRLLDKEKPIDIDRLLVVTFTQAAAGEMRDRISEALDKALINDPGNIHLKKQSALIHNASITTIDSFCLFLVKNHFHKIGLDPNFRTMTNAESALLKRDTVKAVMEKAYAEADEDFIGLVDSYSQADNDDTIEESIISMYNFTMSYPLPRRWIENVTKGYSFASTDEMVNSSFGGEVADYIIKKASHVLAKIEIAEKLCADGPFEYLTSINADKDFVSAILEAANERNLAKIYDTCKTRTKKTLSRTYSGDEETALRVKSIRKSWQDEIDNNIISFFQRDLDAQWKAMKLAGKNLNAFMKLVLQFLDTFEASKRERGLIDFSDMEHMALDILIDDYEDTEHYTVSDVARQYREFFDEVMVDEYQDSNLVQEIILKSVSREEYELNNNRFMVGDIKQSIYRFRLARPKIFADKKVSFALGGKQRNHLITLKENYRSRKEVIDSVNAVFERLMTDEFFGTGYDDNERLYAAADYPESPSDNTSELLIADMSDKESDFSEDEMIAMKIKELHDNFIVYDKDDKVLRPAKYSDMCILLRNKPGNDEGLKKCLERYNIPFYVSNSGAFYKTREIQEVMNYLRVLENPLSDISLYGALTSFFGGFTDEDIVKIKAAKEPDEYYLYDMLKGYIQRNPGDERFASFNDTLLKYRKLSKYTPVAALISQILDESGYTLYVGALPDGERRLANVKMLVGKAKEYAGTSFKGLFHFIRYVELIDKIDTDEGEADVFDEKSDVVRLLTIHKSKGLEFPIVFVSKLNHKVNYRDASDNFIKDMDLGVGVKYVDVDRRVNGETWKRRIISDKVKEESLAEEIRVLYVALTRAREKLILTTAWKKDLEKIETADLEGTSTYIDLLLPSVLKNRNVFKVSVIDKTSVVKEEVKDIVNLSKLKDNLITEELRPSDIKIYDRLKERFAFEYPFENLSKLITKTTVSELKIKALEEEMGESLTIFKHPEREEIIPVFAGGETDVSGTDRGSAYHKILSMLDFTAFLKAGISYKDELERQMTELVKNERTTVIEKEMISVFKFTEFLKTELAARMGKAMEGGNLFLEKPFVMGMEASVYDKSFPSEETLLIQGVIDVYFIENNEIVLLDYKTDRVETEEELVSRYKTQLDYYSVALERLTGLKVKEKLLYSFGLGTVIVVE